MTFNELIGRTHLQLFQTFTPWNVYVKKTIRGSLTIFTEFPCRVCTAWSFINPYVTSNYLELHRQRTNKSEKKEEFDLEQGRLFELVMNCTRYVIVMITRIVHCEQRIHVVSHCHRNIDLVNFNCNSNRFSFKTPF